MNTAPRHRIPLVVGSAVTVTALAFALGGCSSTNSSGAASTASAADIAVGSVGTMDQMIDISDICPSEGEYTLGIVDGFGTNSWSKTVRAEIEAEAAKCPAITDISYEAGRGDLQATTAAITSMAAQGTDIVLVIPDAGPGEAHLSALRTAVSSGSTVVTFASDPEGSAGADYLDYTDWSPTFSGGTWAQWVVDQLGEAGGNVVFLGGPAGSAVAAQELEGIKAVFADNPQITLLTDEPVTTNWDPAQAQQAMSGLLSQYPQIDAVIVDYGASTDGVIRAYQAAGIPLPPIATTDQNSLSCGFDALKADNPTYELATVSSRTWVGRVALRKALASLAGESDTEPSIYNLSLAEDSTGGTAGASTPSEVCSEGAPADGSPSSLLTPDEVETTFAN
ncbi:substrate-binding domain-containing protein [Herbiconiux moechotypicola]|uniref:Periplasmic binding protein domain-containing protein n=1 Tax=Herbiconiux moechotypicola TaxID=637393 RepID=A0ABN3DCY0_9MICO|nr:substrate-binding domain-containing protein [Herbiconiux moechotypicola]MCS5728710.1 substrate-binding domain-containing protein [Herbiconiux moechotypicola]